jgi:hypothetical protein
LWIDEWGKRPKAEGGKRKSEKAKRGKDLASRQGKAKFMGQKFQIPKPKS